MSIVLADRVQETTITTGTGTIHLDGAVTQFQSFIDGVGNGNQTYYCIVSNNTTSWEVGIGTVTAGTPNTLSRTTILASSNGGSVINLSGPSTVFGNAPAALLSILATGTTGSGAVVLANSPTFTNPNIGAATGSSLALSSAITAQNLLPCVTLEQFGGGVSAGSLDNTPALNAAVSYCLTSGNYGAFTILLPGRATYYFNSRPNPIMAGIFIVGCGSSQTSVIRNYSESGGSSAGLFTFTQNNSDTVLGGGIYNMSISAATGTTGGSAISMIATGPTSGNGIGFNSIKDVVVTYSGTGAFGVPLWVDGTANSGTFTGPPGWRDLYVENSFFFTPYTGGNTLAAYFANVDNLRTSGFYAAGDVHITGTSATNCQTNRCVLMGEFLDNITIDHADILQVYGICGGSLDIDSTCSDVGFWGSADTITNNSASSSVVASRSLETGPQSFGLTDASGASLSLTVNIATYSRVNNTVTISFNISFPPTSSTATIAINGFPVTAPATYETTPFIVWNASAGSSFLGQISPGSSLMTVYTLAGANAENSAFSNCVMAATFTMIDG